MTTSISRDKVHPRRTEPSSETGLGWVQFGMDTVFKLPLSYAKEAVVYGDNVNQAVSGVPSIQLTGWRLSYEIDVVSVNVHGRVVLLLYLNSWRGGANPQRRC